MVPKYLTELGIYRIEKQICLNQNIQTSGTIYDILLMRNLDFEKTLRKLIICHRNDIPENFKQIKNDITEDMPRITKSKPRPRKKDYYNGIDL